MHTFPFFQKEIKIHSMFRYKNNYDFVSNEGTFQSARELNIHFQ